MSYALHLYRVLLACGWTETQAREGVSRWFYGKARQVADAEGDDRKRVLRGLQQGPRTGALPIGRALGDE